MPDPKEVVRIQVHRVLQRRCVCCHKQFRPHPRVGVRQKTCGETLCRNAHRASWRRKFRKKNPQAEQDIQRKIREARAPEFWKNYRKNHPLGSARNRAQSRLRKRLTKVGLQRQLDIVQLVDPPGKLAAVIEFATSHRSLLFECLGKSAA